MSEPQAGIIPEPSEATLFLVLRVRDRERDARAVARLAARVPALAARIAKAEPRGKLVSVVGLGPELWNRVSPGRRPQWLRPFVEIDTGELRAPATGGDLLLHAIARRRDLCFWLAMQLRSQLGDLVEVMDEVHGFKYLDARDLTGFIDGTENPRGRRARTAVALIGAEDPGFAGGSYVFTQRYVHDLGRWSGLPVREQEKVIGRRKKDSTELSARTRPPTAHISRVVISEDGDELEIVRHSSPYGTTSEAGLFFIAYTKDLRIPQRMLERMLGASGDGLHDHLMDYSTAVSGAHFFAPSLKVLRELGRG